MTNWCFVFNITRARPWETICIKMILTFQRTKVTTKVRIFFTSNVVNAGEYVFAIQRLLVHQPLYPDPTFLHKKSVKGPRIFKGVPRINPGDRSLALGNQPPWLRGFPGSRAWFSPCIFKHLHRPEWFAVFCMAWRAHLLTFLYMPKKVSLDILQHFSLLCWFFGTLKPRKIFIQQSQYLQVIIFHESLFNFHNFYLIGHSVLNVCMIGICICTHLKVPQ